MLDVKEMHPKAGEFAELLLKSCEKLGKALEDFDEFKNSKKINKLIIDVGSVEEEADELFFHTLRELYSHGEENPCMCSCGISCSSASRTQQTLASRLPIPWAPSS